MKFNTVGRLFRLLPFGKNVSFPSARHSVFLGSRKSMKKLPKRFLTSNVWFSSKARWSYIMFEIFFVFYPGNWGTWSNLTHIYIICPKIIGGSEKKKQTKINKKCQTWRQVIRWLTCTKAAVESGRAQIWKTKTKTLSSDHLEDHPI